MKVQLKVAGMLAMLVRDRDRCSHAWAQRKSGSERQDYRNREAGRHGSPHEGDRHVEGSLLREVCTRTILPTWSWSW